MRRLKLLYRFHSDERIDQEIVESALDEARRAVNEQSLLFHTVLSRFSSRQKQRIIYPGCVGKIFAEGDFSSLYPWLAVGEYVHVGKGCSFGLGQYKLTILES
jgi:CRISPR/Cas system endoribonuclease Cas6 (RAMP superfamily)